MQKSETLTKDDTRARLLAAAAAIFADVGYQAATTRDICARANANPAAVNYHFGDKLGLYTEVLRTALCFDKSPAEPLTNEESAERAFEVFVRSLFDNMGHQLGTDHYARLMAHELAQPTPGLALVVEQIIRPRADRLCEIVARLTGYPKTSRQTRLNAQSIIAQIMHYWQSRPIVKLLWPDWRQDDAQREKVIEHVTHFSRAAMGTVKPKHRGRSAL